ncbi:MAG: tetratricopeptide repeat protein [Microcoleaceae cyanobacterium]
MSQPQPQSISNSTPHQIAMEWYKKGEKAVCDGDLEQAKTCYQKATQSNPKFFWAYHKLGDSLSKLQRWQFAIKAYRQAIELKSDFFWSYHNLGNALSQLQRWKPAISAYTQAIQIKPDFCWSYYNLGDAFAQKQQWQQAVKAYIQAEKLQQDLPGLSQRLGQVLHQHVQKKGLKLVTQQYIKSCEVLENIDKTQDIYQFCLEDFTIYTHLANTLEAEEYFLGAAILYQIALQFKPNLSQTDQSLKRVLAKQAELENQLISARKVAENHQNSYQANYELGVILSQQQQSDAAISAYLKAIQLQPEQPLWLYQGLWENLEQQGRLEELIQLYRNAISLQPHSVWCYVNLGEIFSRQGQFEEAIQCYQAAAYQKIQQVYPDWMNQIDQLIPVKKPNFLVIGTQKGGTTSLYYYLAQHPQIVPSLIKEIEFWSHKQKRGLEWYLSHFLPQLKQGNFITGEATPSYLDHSGVAESIYQAFPDIKLIILLRDPTDRAISHYYQWFSLRWESRSLQEAMNREINQYRESVWNQPNSYLARGVYIEFIKKWLDIFPREQVLILPSEDFYQNPAQVLTQVFHFLGLPNCTLPEYKPYNARSYPEVNQETKKLLINYFKPHNQALEEYLGQNFNWKG